MINAGGFGFTVAEIFTFFYACSYLVLNRRTFKLPHVLYLFFIIICIARLGAFANSIKFDIPIDYTKLVFLLVILIQVSSFNVAKNSTITFDEILTTRYAKYVIGSAFMLALVYTISGTDLRAKLMAPFWPGGDFARLVAPRFPGLGMNANIYAYFVFIFLVFSLKNYFTSKSNFTIPFFCLALIIFCASKTILILATLAMLSFPVYYFLWSNRVTERKARKRAFVVLCVAFGLGIIGVIVSQNETITDYVIVLRRLDGLLNNSTDLDDRYLNWRLGMERVWLAPVFGIDIVPGKMVSDTIPLFYANPHNEFIFYWMSLGILGLISYPIIIIYFMLKNLLAKLNIVWVFLFFSLLLQMLFDGAFEYFRFQFFFFLLIGLNFRDLTYKLRTNEQKQFDIIPG